MKVCVEDAGGSFNYFNGDIPNESEFRDGFAAPKGLVCCILLHFAKIRGICASILHKRYFALFILKI